MPVRISSPRFVGRTDELERLLGAYKAAAADERATIVLVGGEAGVGKSRLIAELAARVDEAAGLVLVGSCLDLSNVALPFGPVVQALRIMQRCLDPSALATVVGSAGEVLDRWLPEVPNPTGPEDVTTAALFEHLRGVLERLGDHTPALIVLEDLHWADNSTRDLLVYLARNLQSARIALVGTYRSDDLHRRHPLRAVLAELDRSGIAHRLDLARFDREELHEMIGSILGAEPSADLLDAVFDRSDGNAFFAEELIAAGGTGDQLPASLRDILLTRIDGLSDAAQGLLGIAAVVGRRADHRLVAALAEEDESTSTAGLREAMEHQVLVVDPHGTAYEFRHALVGEAVYDDLLPGVRVRLHARLAELLTAHPEWSGGGPVGVAGEVAGHWFAAHDVRRALPALLAAASEAERMCANPEALAHVERALELWPQVPDAADVCGVRHVDLLRQASELAELAGLVDRSLEFVETAGAQVDPVDDPITAGLLHDRWAGCLRSAGGSFDQALAHVEIALSLIPETHPAERARVLATQGSLLMLASRNTEGIEPCRAAIELARQTGDTVIEANARNSLAVMVAGLGDLELGLTEMRRARDQAASARAWDAVARAYVNECAILASAARHQEALELGIEGVDVARSHGRYNRVDTCVLPTICDQLWPLGRWADMEPHLDHMAAARPQGTDEWCILKKWVEWHAGRGEHAEAEADLDRLRELLGSEVEESWQFEVAHLEVELALWRGDVGSALERAVRGMGITTTESLSPESDAAEALALHGMAAATQRSDLAAARAIAGRFDEWVRTELWGPGPPGDLDLVSRQVAAELAVVEARADADDWAGIAEGWSALGMVPRETVARWREAELRLAAGDRGGAVAAARVAYEQADRVGWQWARDGIADLARRGRLEIGLDTEAASAAGATADRVPPAARDLGLTAREVEVLALVAAGRTNRQIADTLYISVKTASTHVSNLLFKLGVTNRGEAGAAAHRLGLD